MTEEKKWIVTRIATKQEYVIVRALNQEQAIERSYDIGEGAWNANGFEDVEYDAEELEASS